MADNTTNIVSQVIAALKTNGADISQLTPTDNPADTDLIELSGGKYVKFGVIRKIVEDAFADLERIDTILSGRINKLATDHATDKASMQSTIASLRADLDAIDHDNATEAIESFREILAFLDGCKDDETLLAKLTEIKALITAEAAGRAEADTALGVRIDDLASDVEVFDSQHTQSIESLDNRVETNAHSIIDLGNQLQAQAISAQEADDTLRGLIAERNRRFYHLPDNFATEQALFSAAATYVIGSKPLCPGALLLGCVDECWGVYQYVYFNDELEISAQSAESVQAASAAAPTIAPPAVKHDANVSNPENWVRLATIEDIAALKKLVPVVELTAEEIAALLPADESQIATLELDEDEAGADQPATCEALERFRTRLREMRGRSVFKPKEVYNPNDYINYEHE